MNQPVRHSSFRSAVFYRDPRAALDWLERAFGFERSFVVSQPDGTLAHAEMTFGDGTLMIGGEWAEFVASPVDIGGKNSQCVHVQLADGIDAHCERARRAGAVILQEPTDQFYGDRTYRARDPEQHVWTFGQRVRAVSRDEAVAATGLTIEGWA
jgi:uncharacterized glyoxalase superfamily protein PhnB